MNTRSARAVKHVTHQKRTRMSVLRAIAAMLAVVICAGGFSLLLTSPSQAAGEAVFVRSVDTRNFPNVEIQAMQVGAESSTEGIRITENGKAVQPKVESFSKTGVPTGIVLMIDTSADARDSDAFERGREAAIKMVENKANGQQFAIVGYNISGRVVANFTDDVGSLKAILNGLNGNGESALYDGLRTATKILQERPDLQPNVVVLNASREALSNSSGEEALQGLHDANAALFSASVTNADGHESAALQNFANSTKGRHYEVSDPAAFTQVLAGVSSALSKQAVITYKSQADQGALSIEVSNGSATETARVATGTLNIGAAATPDAVEARNLGIFGGPVGMILLGIVALVAVALLVYVISEVASFDRNQLSRALRPYNTDEVAEDRDFSKLADSDFIKRAVAETAKIAERRGLLTDIERRLEQAQVPLRPAEALFFTVAIALVAMLLGVLLLGFIGLVVAGLVFAALPVMALSMKANRRRRKFNSQLPDTLQLLAGSLRAGYSLVQGLDAVAQQIEAPMGDELTRALSEARLGRPVEDALRDISERVGSDDFEWVVMAIKIQREVGGNLAELLMTVSNTMVEREGLRREVRALTAEGRLSAYILIAMPPGIFGLVMVMNPTYMQPMYQTLLGQAILAGSVLSLVVGFLIMNKVIQVEV